MRTFVITLVMLASVTALAGELQPVTDFGVNPGALDMFEYVPAGLPADRPLVVVLHGCTQTAAAMEVAGWNALADANGFAVLYPGQRKANQGLGCFTWYAAGDISRDQGEAKSIITMVDAMIANHGSDRSRVFVTGLSAGGAFTTVMLAAYPDRFAAGSVMAGLPYHCATDVASTSGCQQGTTTKSPAAWGDLVRAASDWQGPWPRVQVFQGTADHTVAPANEQAIVDQWTDVHATDRMADVIETIGPAMHASYLANGAVVVDTYLITGMGHGISTGDDPSGPCPATTGAYFEDHGLCSTTRAAAFFGVVGTGSGGGGDAGTDDPMANGGGGCSTGGESGLAGLGLALGAVLLARRRR